MGAPTLPGRERPLFGRRTCRSGCLQTDVSGHRVVERIVFRGAVGRYGVLPVVGAEVDCRSVPFTGAILIERVLTQIDRGLVRGVARSGGTGGRSCGVRTRWIGRPFALAGATGNRLVGSRSRGLVPCDVRVVG